ncbi:hypothetical protein [Enhygromyxa salina]|uniref:hypothetical protein n=1 Tax=Enhygromyxa salina TaxID=215803 RepID=UPI000D03E027|nr:hypothetical protein [Enhygromyxa salina]
MDEPAGEQLRELGRRDAEHALGLAVRALVHELRNAINPMPMQLAVLRKAVTRGRDLQEVLDGLDQSILRARETLHTASRLADEFAPPDADDS